MMNRRSFIRTLLGAAALSHCSKPGHSRLTDSGAFAPQLRIAYFTDVHCRIERGVPEALSYAARAITSVSADLIIGGGDFITEGFESCPEALTARWNAYQDFQSELRGSFEPVIGNHDLVAARPSGDCVREHDPRDHFRKFFGIQRTYRSISAGGYHIMLLDSIVEKDDAFLYHGEIDARQQEWIRSDLETVDPSTPIIVVSHLPFRTSYFDDGTSPPPNRMVTNADKVLSLFREKNLILVLQGHLHINELLEQSGVSYITGGAICGRWWQGPWKGTAEGFGVLTLRGNTLEWEYRSYGWHRMG